LQGGTRAVALFHYQVAAALSQDRPLTRGVEQDSGVLLYFPRGALRGTTTLKFRTGNYY
jgi:hypothetical protein